MSKNAPSPVWPFLSVLACLFMLSITAPRAWERLAHKGELAKRLEAVEREHRSEQLAAQSPPSHQEIAAAPAPDKLAVDRRAPSVAPKNPAADFCQTTAELASRGSRRFEEFERQAKSASTPAPQTALQTALDNGLAEGPAPGASFDEPALPSGPQLTSSPAPSQGETADWPTLAAPVALETAPAFGNLAQDRPEAGRPSGGADRVAPAADPQELAADSIALPPESRDAALVPPPAATLDRAEVNSADMAPVMPAALLRQLAALDHDPFAGEWAISVQCQLQLLAAGTPTANQSIIEQLAASAREARQAAEQAPDAATETRLLRAVYAIQRRLPLWRAVLAESVARRQPVFDDRFASRNPRFASREFDGSTRLTPHARPSFDPTASPRPKWQADESAEIGRRSLASVADAPRDAGVARRLLSEVEAYERSGLPSDAAVLAASYQALTRSTTAADRRLRAELEENYENANLRVAVAGSLINRLLPHPEAARRPVAETLAGVPVRGQSTVWTQLYARLLPDPQRVRIGLEATGTVASDTFSTSGPATFRNAGRSTFQIQKLFVLGPWGLRSWPAISDAHTIGGRLIAVETDYDGIPLIGSLVRNVARSQYDQNQAQVTAEADARLAGRSRTQFDSEIDGRLARAETALVEKALRPIERLGLDLTPVAFSTTDDRVVARYRLAAADQLGAHTPRPRAPSDSLFSIQLHESAINNLLAKVGLEGRRFTLQELMAFVAGRFDRPPAKLADDVPDDLVITFAQRDAARVRLHDDRMELYLSFASVEHGRNVWRDFTVSTSYAPHTRGLESTLERESGVFLDGPGLRGRAELVLRGIFSRALSRNRHIELGGEKPAHDPRLQYLEITQIALDDGWLGLAYGPNRKDRAARRPTSTSKSR